MNSVDWAGLKLPGMRMVQQRFESAPAADVLDEIDREWSRIHTGLDLPPGSQIAIGVGSRGISNLSVVVQAVVIRLKEAGYDPFVTPAMGSHGGATAEGQMDVLRHRGITEESVGAPVKATMDVTPMGEVNGIPLFLDRLAYEADGIVLINRIKPHTNFIGPTESGIIKMMAIGLATRWAPNTIIAFRWFDPNMRSSAPPARRCWKNARYCSGYACLKIRTMKRHRSKWPGAMKWSVLKVNS